MSLVARVARVAGVTVSDVHRVLSHGGTTRADWAIAHAIEQVTGRPAVEIMWAAPARQSEPEAPAPTNPRAVHDPEVVIYAENTSPEAAPTVLPDHPGTVEDDTVEDLEDEQTDETDPGRGVWNTMLHTHVWADVAALTNGTPSEITRTVSLWSTARDAITGMTALIVRHHEARTSNTIAAELAA